MINWTYGLGFCAVAEQAGRKKIAELCCSSLDTQEGKERREEKKIEEDKEEEKGRKEKVYIHSLHSSGNLYPPTWLCFS